MDFTPIIDLYACFIFSSMTEPKLLKISQFFHSICQHIQYTPHTIPYSAATSTAITGLVYCYSDILVQYSYCMHHKMNKQTTTHLYRNLLSLLTSEVNHSSAVDTMMHFCEYANKLIWTTYEVRKQLQHSTENKHVQMYQF